MIAAVTGVMEADKVRSVAGLPLLALPDISHMAWSFDVNLIIPFVVTALATAMTSTAIVASYQRITDAEWVRPDMR